MQNMYIFLMRQNIIESIEPIFIIYIQFKICNQLFIQMNNSHRQIRKFNYYEIQKILDFSWVGSCKYYKIHWKGFKQSEATWNPLSSLKAVKQICKQFYDNLTPEQKQKKYKFPSKKLNKRKNKRSSKESRSKNNTNSQVSLAYQSYQHDKLTDQISHIIEQQQSVSRHKDKSPVSADAQINIIQQTKKIRKPNGQKRNLLKQKKQRINARRSANQNINKDKQFNLVSTFKQQLSKSKQKNSYSSDIEKNQVEVIQWNKMDKSLLKLKQQQFKKQIPGFNEQLKYSYLQNFEQIPYPQNQRLKQQNQRKIYDGNKKKVINLEKDIKINPKKQMKQQMDIFTQQNQRQIITIKNQKQQSLQQIQYNRFIQQQNSINSNLNQQLIPIYMHQKILDPVPQKKQLLINNKQQQITLYKNKKKHNQESKIKKNLFDSFLNTDSVQSTINFYKKINPKFLKKLPDQNNRINKIIRAQFNKNKQIEFVVAWQQNSDEYYFPNSPVLKQIVLKVNPMKVLEFYEEKISWESL